MEILLEILSESIQVWVNILFESNSICALALQQQPHHERVIFEDSQCDSDTVGADLHPKCNSQRAHLSANLIVFLSPVRMI